MGVVAGVGAGVVDVGSGDRVALALVEPSVPRVVNGETAGGGLMFDDGYFGGKGAAIVDGFLINPVTAVRAVAVKQVQVAVAHFDPLAVGAEGGNVFQGLPRGNIAGFFGDDVDLAAFARSAEVVFAELGFAAVATEDEVNVALAVYDERGATVVIEFTGIDLVRGFAHGIHARVDRTDPFARSVMVRGNVGVFVWARIGDVGHALVMFGGRMLERADGVAVAVVGKIIDVGGTGETAAGERNAQDD